MANPASIIEQLQSVVCCPECRGELTEQDAAAVCGSCHATYTIKQGIPLLLPRNVALEHLQEEEKLAKMMREPSRTEEHVVSDQWKRSKDEFWSMVTEGLGNAPGTLANIGCGYDRQCIRPQQIGCKVVNMDIVYEMVSHLRDQGVEGCICGDISSLPLKSNSLDYLVCIDVIHHEFDKVESILASFADVLKPGGKLFLQDPNAWGLFQFPKSILLPKPLFKLLRKAYHAVKPSLHQPADYEFCTSIWATKRILRNLGFENVTVHENHSYPNIAPVALRVYQRLGSRYLRLYHNYHYTISAVKPGG